MKKLISIVLLLAMCLTAFAACGTKGPSEELIAAGDYLFGLYKDDPTTTAADYDVAGRVMVGTVAYDVAWTVDVTEGVTIKASEKSGFMTIDVNEKTENEIAYTLTATITDENGDTVQKTFQRTVPAYKVFSYAEYAAAANGDTVVVKGVITGIFSKTNGSSGNGVYIQDMNNEGGYYVYGLADGKDPEADLGLKVGMTVEAVGQKDIYNGLYEIIDASFEILEAAVKAVEPVDYTEIFTSAEALNDAALVGKQSMLVTVKGVEITGQDTGSGYYKFALGGKETYVRISSSNNCITKDEQAAFIAAHTENFGYVADVTGIIQLYNGSFYLIPVTADAFTNYKEVIKTPAEKVEAEKNVLNIGASFSDDTVIDLAATGKYYDDVTITWVTDNETNAAIADGKLTLVIPEEAVTVTVTATIVCADVTETKTFEIVLSKAPVTIPEALEIPDGSNVLVSGTVKEINTEWSEQYGNITVTIEDEAGNTLYVYRLKANVKVGDIITIKGKMGTYNGTRQVAAGATATIDDPAPVEVSLTEAVALDDGVRVIVKGTVKEINTAWSEQYGNITVTIEDEAGNTLYIYRLKANVNVGDVVTITGKVGSYNGSKQIAAGATAVVEDGSNPEPAGPVEVTIPEAIALEDGAEIIVSGTVSEINTEWSEEYGNITVTITDGTNTLYVYRMKTNVKIGDVITITGKVGSYNGDKQIAAGATAIITESAPVEVSLAEAVALEDGVNVIVKGTVKEINTEWSEQYGNISVTIEDEAGNTLYIYRLKANVQVGDKVTITGKVGSYNGSKQIAAGATAEIGE